MNREANQHGLKRVASLDCFRGYAVLGMLVVNFLGGYSCSPRILRHTNDYCSYADTIMPHFFFAVGFALQLAWTKRNKTQLSSSNSFARWLGFRILVLTLISMVLYFPWSTKDLLQRILTSEFWLAVLKRDWFQTLLHIAITSVWVAPMLRYSVRLQLCWIAFSAVAHAALSQWFYFHWIHSSPRAIDGGPLGFLTWSIPLESGVLACRCFQNNPLSTAIRKWLVVGLSMMLAGYFLSCGTRLYDVEQVHAPESSGNPLAKEPVVARSKIDALSSVTSTFARLRFAELPGIPPPLARERQWNYWMMSQRAGTLSYQMFAAGFSLLLFAIMAWLMDVARVPLQGLAVLGRHALLVYVAHGFIEFWMSGFLKRESTCWTVLVGLVAFLAINLALAMMATRIAAPKRREPIRTS